MTDTEHNREHQPEDGEARLTIRLPQRLHRQFKVLAAVEGRSMGDIVIEMIREHVRCSRAEDFVYEPPQVEEVNDPHTRRDKIGMIMDLRREGWSFGAIAFEMNEREVLNLKSKQGWSKGAVYRVVMNCEKKTPLELEDEHQKAKQPKDLSQLRMFDFDDDEPGKQTGKINDPDKGT